MTVDVGRYFKPAKGADEAVFPMDENVDPRLKTGDHVLIGIPGNSAEPDLWTTNETEIARERSWIEKELTGSENLPCE